MSAPITISNLEEKLSALSLKLDSSGLTFDELDDMEVLIPLLRSLIFALRFSEKNILSVVVPGNAEKTAGEVMKIVDKALESALALKKEHSEIEI